MMNTMKVELEGMSFFARHGCLESERRNGGEFRVSVRYCYDASKAAITDDLRHAADYSKVYPVVKREMEKPSMLLENVAWRILCALEKALPEVSGLEVCVSKKNPPVGGPAEWSSVTAYQR